MLVDPRSGSFVVWGNASLSGLVPLDDAVDGVIGDDEPHRVAGLPGEEHAVGLSIALGRLRALGVTGLRLSLPVPGDPLGLPGPSWFNDLAMEAGEAVVTVGSPGDAYGLVPEVTVHGPEGDSLTRVRWRVCEVEDRPIPGPFLAEAERELAEAIRDATGELTRLDVGGGDAGVQRVLAALFRGEPGSARPAPGHPPRAARVLDQARRIHAILDLAARGHGAAVSAAEIAARAGALAPLERACRRAMVAAYNAALEPGRP